MSGRKFLYRIDSNNEAAIREDIVIRQTVNTENVFKVTIGINKKGEMVAPHIIIKNFLREDENPIFRERGRGKKGLYYPLNLMSYLCEIEIKLQSNDEWEEKLSIYIPKKIVDSKKILFKEVTESFKEEIQNEILEKLRTFAVSRLSERVTKHGLTKEKANLILNF